MSTKAHFNLKDIFDKCLNRQFSSLNELSCAIKEFHHVCSHPKIIIPKSGIWL